MKHHAFLLSFSFFISTSAFAHDLAAIDEVTQNIVAGVALSPDAVAAAKLYATSEAPARTRPYYETLAARAAFYAAWQEPADKRGAALATALGSAVTPVTLGSYDPSGKRLALSVQATAGRCYAFVGRWQRPTKHQTEGLEVDHRFVFKPAMALPVFSVEQRPARGKQEIFVGTCAEQTGSLAIEVIARYVRANTLDWAVLSWPRDQFPVALSTGLHLGFDPCDAELWARMWTKPLAGTLAYKGSEPLLVLNPQEPDKQTAQTIDLGGRGLLVPKSDLSVQPNGAVSVRASYRAPQCRPSASINPKASGYHGCVASVRGSYEGRIAAAASRSANAKSALAYDAAEAEVAKLIAAQDQELGSRCTPLYKQLTAGLQTAFERTRSQLERATPPPPSVAGVARVKAEYDAFK